MREKMTRERESFVANACDALHLHLQDKTGVVTALCI